MISYAVSCLKITIAVSRSISRGPKMKIEGCVFLPVRLLPYLPFFRRGPIEIGQVHAADVAVAAQQLVHRLMHVEPAQELIGVDRVHVQDVPVRERRHTLCDELLNILLMLQEVTDLVDADAAEVAIGDKIGLKQVGHCGAGGPSPQRSASTYSISAALSAMFFDVPHTVQPSTRP